jgi:hypothetical protein
MMLYKDPAQIGVELGLLLTAGFGVAYSSAAPAMSMSVFLNVALGAGLGPTRSAVTT